jgi:hypothetical protein
MTAISPMYRIGPSDLFDNTDLNADAATLDKQIGLLDDQDMTTVSPAFFEGWLAFLAEWKKFYADTFLNSWFGPAWNDSNRDQLIQFETRFGTWSQQYTAETNQPLPGGVIAPSTGSGDTLGAQLANQLRPLGAVASAYKWWLIGGAAVVLAVVYREPILRALKVGA